MSLSGCQPILSLLLVLLHLCSSARTCVGPGKVANLKSEWISGSKVRLTWDSPQAATTCDMSHYVLSHCATSTYWRRSCNYTVLSLPVNTTQVSLSVQRCEYNHIVVTAVSPDGNSSAESIVVSPRVEHPEQPTNLAVDVVNSTTFALSWDDPAGESTACREGYRVCFKVIAEQHDDYECVFAPSHVSYPDTKNRWTNSHASSTAGCTDYSASVASVYNSLDLDGVASDAATIAFRTGPENVENLDVKATSPTNISLKWKESRSGCADRYTVSWCNVPYPWYDRCDAEARNLTTDVTFFEITNLTACSYYWVTVSTEGADGLKSATRNLIVTLPVGDEVRDLDLVYDHGSKFAALWQVAGGGACISSYQVCWRPEDRQEDEECDSSLRDNYESSNLNLQACSNYTVSVASLDIFNGSSENITARFTTGPENVARVNVSLVTDHSAAVSWDPSPSSCAAIYVLGWCATAYPDEPCNPSSATTVYIDANTTEHVISSLEPCTYNVISIRTRAADGGSSDTTQQTVKTRLGEFGPTTNIELTASNSRSFFLEYRAPSDAALCMAGYMGCFKEENSTDDFICSRTSNLQFWTNSNSTKACTKYDVQLVALSGDGRTWNKSMAFTSPPDEVLDLRVVNSTTGPNGTTVLVTWQVSADNGCMSHQHFNCSRVAVVGNDPVLTAIWSTGADLPGNVTRYQVRDLQPCMPHTVDVLQQPVPLYPIPTQILFYPASNVTSVANLSLDAAGEGSVNISYVALQVSPRCVSKYSVCWSESRTRNRTCRYLRGAGRTRFAVEGLANCTSYTLAVTPVAPNDVWYNTSTIEASTTGCTATSAGGSTLLEGYLVVQIGFLLCVSLYW